MIVELFSGLGRFETEEEVVYIGIQRETKPTICPDVRYLPLRPGLRPRLLHASPPCTYFSFARRGKWVKGNRPNGEYRVFNENPVGIAESLRLVAVAFEAWDYLEAPVFILENPMNQLGRIFNQTSIRYRAHDFEHSVNFWSNSRALKRSVIPKDVRQRILEITPPERRRKCA